MGQFGFPDLVDDKPNGDHLSTICGCVVIFEEVETI